MQRSYYSNPVADFLLDHDRLILGELANHHSPDLNDLQKNAWKAQIRVLKESLQLFSDGYIFFEFGIPRMEKRVDNILIINDLIFVIEFKVGDSKYQKHSIEQVIDYSLDLQNFHSGSHDEMLVPILVSTKAPDFENIFSSNNSIAEPLRANSNNLSRIISACRCLSGNRTIDPDEWEDSTYKPTPTIIEAAQALYKGHNVKEISRHDAGAINLSRTTDCINQIIEAAKANNKKSICFITGVPGAGKTLAGLNIANERMKANQDEHAVFLSGNGPLVDVLREALTRDSVLVAKKRGESSTKKKEKERAVKFIQNIHHFRDDNLISKKAPIEKVVVFDEAQRAWTKKQVSSFMKRKKGVDDFDMSEPEFLIDVMNRHEDWCTIICLIGGGQEINTGEAGLSEWVWALKHHFPEWDIHYSNLISSDKNYLSNTTLQKWLSINATSENEMHLSVSIRSFRSEKVSEFVHSVLEKDIECARELFTKIKNHYPVVLTRNLTKAKNWLRKQANGSERFGIIASSGGRRLRPVNIDVKNEISAQNWFLNSQDDIRSSSFLEEVATEFEIQGLEIDWVCLAWDINLFIENGKWQYQKFSGTKWRNMHNTVDQAYLLNSYRVLLTRARQGLIIFVPKGNDADQTRPKLKYDETFRYLTSIGIPIL